MFEDPFTRDDLSTGRPWHKSPRAVTLESIKLLLHGVTPWGVLERRTYRPRNGTDGRSVAGEGVSRVWLDDAGSCSSDHLVLGRSWCGGLLGCRGVRVRRCGRGADGDVAGGTVVAISIISGVVIVGGGVLALAAMSRHGALPA